MTMSYRPILLLAVVLASVHGILALIGGAPAPSSDAPTGAAASRPTPAAEVGAGTLAGMSESERNHSLAARAWSDSAFRPSVQARLEPREVARERAEVPDAFPLAEWAWRDAEADETGLEPFLEDPLVMTPEPDPWGGEWADQGGDP